ncbi:MAG: UDP-N-acetylmuramoyl-L-alanyl-D-glutamate--2,6-diaminopimelate ligase [Sphingobium sp.]|nr:UDP-N-acetylmuramoyl-L-alanyl-D-glutamate--2,6-diaminopimelate ligase [Sphingobium sp.]MBP6112166.1 UDP-N-acetylmuramoyl-L-alanyl-D-glutamate--2,6-diaminopimelate ligase [Sphingobium sp.]MBP8670362.1 UDP-N-acetylmuramoyl-L-alanyl-D-glutamate--2,6-diaminopimelate ligase [Sphingobium sp.]MBP9157676.1 UDP-N-acetylmuramoyl-L-alanyl-D-glutamate--2,6-diaminopimelate ligase [Sphingobium sp.]MCC6482869.1 UDP-N-acetylmuramoyl-L-alanyl-D-glutamate--2,6-diaminopimelate ligase [Sphingomonadaceae bacteri
MRLDRLADGLAGNVPEVAVTGFAIDNRKVAPGCVFGAFEGARVNGEDFIPQAVAAGAVAVVARPEAKVEGVFHVESNNPRRLFARMAAQFYAPFPDTCVAVTGTNGKTSTVELTRQIWRALGHKSASIGTLGVTTSVDQVSTGLTTPDIVTFLSNMAGLKKEGITHAAFEASSHGLAQYRTEGLPVIAGAFTNLSRDHLDYHGDMESYYAAKMRLFDEVIVDDGAAVIWADDARSADVIARASARGLRLVTVGEGGETLRLVSRAPTALGQKLVIAADGVEHSIDLPLIGAYQAANVLISAGLVLACGTPWGQIMPHLSRLQPVRGRLERAVLNKTGAPVYVDYAHTPDGLRAAIEALRPHTKGRLIVLFGAGGDRDAGKRPLMGKVAAELADHVIVTDDNPRSEDPTVIRAAIMAGAPGAQEIGGRRAAIAAAIAQAGPQDIVLLAGKGHEQGQIIGERVLPFDDVEVARECAQ